MLCKGHSAAALYTTLALAGYFDVAELDTFLQPLSRLNGHPDRNKVPGRRDEHRPLGHGFPVAVGIALSGQMDGADRRTFVLTGDGELQEGSMWEAAMAAGHFGLDKLVCIVDRNRLQQGDRTETTMGLDPLPDKFQAFGWAVRETDGNDPAALLETFAALPFEPGKPNCIVANTTKGKGVSFIEDRSGVAPPHPHRRGVRPGRGRAGREPGMTAEASAKLYDCRDAFADTLVELAQADKRVVAVVNDSLGSTKVGKLDKVLPAQVVNVGIAEQNMVGIGAGLANGGKIPFVGRCQSLPHRPGAGADQGRCGLQRRQREAGGREQRRGLRRAGTDPPLHRGHRLDPRHRPPRGHRAS